MSQIKYISTTETAKIIRTELKKNFPGTRFSVTSKIYSGGSSIDVRWEDGPDDRAVKAITEMFQGASFDPMQDLKSPVDGTLNGEKVHFGADYVFTQRSYSVRLRDAIISGVATKYDLGQNPKWNDNSTYGWPVNQNFPNTDFNHFMWAYNCLTGKLNRNQSRMYSFSHLRDFLEVIETAIQTAYNQTTSKEA